MCAVYIYVMGFLSFLPVLVDICLNDLLYLLLQIHTKRHLKKGLKSKRFI